MKPKEDRVAGEFIPAGRLIVAVERGAGVPARRRRVKSVLCVGHIAPELNPWDEGGWHH